MTRPKPVSRQGGHNPPASAAKPARRPVVMPCACARAAIARGFMDLDPDCAANRCKELRG